MNVYKTKFKNMKLMVSIMKMGNTDYTWCNLQVQLVVQLAIKLAHLYLIIIILLPYVQYLIPTILWPIYSGITRRPLISLDIHDQLILYLIEVSVMIFFVISVMVFYQQIIPS